MNARNHQSILFTLVGEYFYCEENCGFESIKNGPQSLTNHLLYRHSDLHAEFKQEENENVRK